MSGSQAIVMPSALKRWLGLVKLEFASNRKNLKSIILPRFFYPKAIGENLPMNAFILPENEV